MKTPLEEYLQEKTAGNFTSGLRGAIREGGAYGVGRDVGSALRGGAMAAGGAAAVGLAGLAAQKLYDAATKAHDFKNMLENNPDLAEAHAENPRQFNQMFSTLRTFNPAFSRDPLVAGSYMRSMVSEPMHAGSKAVEALQSRDKTQGSLDGRILGAAFSGVSAGHRK